MTTTKARFPDCVTRAEAVARRCGLPYVERRDSLPRLLARTAADAAYVVGRERVELRRNTLRLAVHESTLHNVYADGRRHPFLRAVAPDGERVERVVDATLGLAKDALHVATLLEARVIGLEASPLLACLCEDGLARLKPPWQAGAARIEVVRTEACAWLDAQPARSADVVLLDPMFETPRKAPAGFELLRSLARDPSPEDVQAARRALVASAARVARRRVVLKLPPGERPEGDWERLSGSSLDYYVRACEAR